MTFQRMMDRLTNGSEEFAAAYLDDLVIYSETWEEHLQSIRSILEHWRAAGLTAKPRKCQFALEQCIYLGHIVGNGVVRPDPSKIVAIQSFQIPQAKKEPF